MGNVETCTQNTALKFLHIYNPFYATELDEVLYSNILCHGEPLQLFF